MSIMPYGRGADLYPRLEQPRGHPRESFRSCGGAQDQTAVLLGTRLFPDMLPLSMQIQLANDSARGGAARLAGAEVPAFEAKDRDFAEWIAATRATIAFLESLKPAQFEGAEDKTITWQTRIYENMQGTPYLFHHVLPNVFFHVTTAYDILRQSGLEIGKQDYLGKA